MEPRIAGRRPPGPPEELAEVVARALRSGTPGILHVRGDSMLPTLPEGSVVRVRPARAEEIPVGRIAVFRKDRLLVIHRLVWKRRIDGILSCAFKGDNGDAVDRVPGDLVLGVVDDRASLGAAPEDRPDRWVPWRWDLAGRFYRTVFLLLSPPVRFVEFLTGRPASLPRGRIRRWLRDGHRGIQSLLFRRRKSR